MALRLAQTWPTQVALRKESVDRNNSPGGDAYAGVASLSARRAWIEILELLADTAENMSLSARRAWIEISGRWKENGFINVALRKESVDRNTRLPSTDSMIVVALRKESVDRNNGGGAEHVGHLVALRKESVDRNMVQKFYTLFCNRRSPQGERG